MSRAFRPLAAILSVMILAEAPVHAGPVTVREVIQIVAGDYNPPELRLHSISQTASTRISGRNGTRSDSRINTLFDINSARINNSSITDPGDANSLFAGIGIKSQDPEGIDIVDQGDLEGTICDCGEITLPGGGFPKWPLLFLAAIPLIFIDDCDVCDEGDWTPTPTPPTPTIPQTPQVPEPASLLLFGSGLTIFGTILRRRYAKSKVNEQTGDRG